VFGNSSTSSPVTGAGSNPRVYYTHPGNIGFLYRQYTGNNLYVYPEHRDHDPGHNGPGEGFGDLYPTNTPYLLISQGSSGSDQPFLRALPSTLAAFRPEVKKKLIETGLLMPTVQMLLRSTNQNVQDAGAYLTGRAHPTVFEGKFVNELAMVEAAHALTLDNLPPMVQLRVLAEDEPVLGRDYFERGSGELLANTPAVIARIVRGKSYRRRLVVSAERSFDVNGRPLTFSWAILRGDKDKISITPLNKARSVAEIIVPYHDRRPIAPGSPLESNRVDIGVFANNGTHYSAPGFVTLYTLDSEARTYDADGRILEIGYGMGETRVTVQNWPAFCEAVQAPAAGKYLRLSQEERDQLTAALPKLRELPKNDTKALDKLLDQAKPSLRVTAAQILNRALGDRELLLRYWRDHAVARGRHAHVERELAAMGLLPAGEAGKDRRLPTAFMLLGKTPTAYESMLIRRATAVPLSDVLLAGTLHVSTITNFVDLRLTTPRVWRDVYHYDERGDCVGWTRYGQAAPQEFNADGFLVTAKDELGRCRQARLVSYVQDPAKTPGRNDNPLRMTLLDEVVTYSYSGKDDRRGKITAKEKVPAK
jgi:hypothetical protein